MQIVVILVHPYPAPITYESLELFSDRELENNRKIFKPTMSLTRFDDCFPP